MEDELKRIKMTPFQETIQHVIEQSKKHCTDIACDVGTIIMGS